MRYFETRKARIEIIPMIDIMLFLLVFFAMMTLRMIPTTGHVTNLPGSKTAATIPPTKLLIEVDENGQMNIHGAVMSVDQVGAWIRAHDPKNLVVTIAGSDKVNLQQLMNSIDAVRQGGATQISLAARAKNN
jgi:biopolymer transport protein ExbD